MSTKAARRIKKTVAKRHKPRLIAEAQFKVTARQTNGAVRPIEEMYHDLEDARRQADWLFNSPGFMQVTLEGPAFDGTVYRPTPEDEAMGAWLAAALDDKTICPSMKYDINRWLDSKHWG